MKRAQWASRDFWANVEPEPNTGCWIFLGSRIPNGYGMFVTGGKNRLAHRVAYELQHGPIPRGKVVRHRCHLKLCMWHLELGDHEDNNADRAQRNRQRQQVLQPSLA